MCEHVLSCKNHNNSQKISKMAKLVLLETRFQTLKLLLMKFSMKQNTFTSILNLRLKGSLCLTLIFRALLLMKFGMNAL
jgi:hypothetical protein